MIVSGRVHVDDPLLPFQGSSKTSCGVLCDVMRCSLVLGPCPSTSGDLRCRMVEGNDRLVPVFQELTYSRPRVFESVDLFSASITRRILEMIYSG